jgi:hypothetical protein
MSRVVSNPVQRQPGALPVPAQPRAAQLISQAAKQSPQGLARWQFLSNF